MSDSRLSAQDARAAAEVHRELGPEYDDAVVESFLSKIDAHIEERVDQRLASLKRPIRPPVDPARLSKRRAVLSGAAIGSVAAGVPLTVAGLIVFSQFGSNPTPLLVIWVVLLSVYGLAAWRLLRR